jgi:hypothetical protein
MVSHVEGIDSEFEAELLSFPVSGDERDDGHDDFPDALTFAPSLFCVGSFEVR